MVNAQIHLDQIYPKDLRNNIKGLDISNKGLEGELVITDFSNLESIKCGNNKKLTNIKIINLPKLNSFHANNCNLVDIKITNCPEIKYFNVANNLLNNTSFLEDLNPEKLTDLSIHSNNFFEQNLEPFSKFTNLQQLFLDNCDKAKFRKGIYNRFTGSLKPLQSLVKLELLGIGKNDIDSGLEYLPQSLRKIGFNSAIKVDTACSKLSRELEEATKLEGVTEKLKTEKEKNSKGKEDEPWFNDYYRIAPWRQALDLLGEEEFRKQNTQQWLEKNYPEEISKNTTFLTINDKNLKGHLDLRDFLNLEKLDCSDNKLTSLDLSKCSKLTHLYCDNNLFTNLNFLNPKKEISLSHPRKLKELYIGDNKEILRQNLDFLVPYIELAELNIENCPFQGSLKSLKNIKKLERIYISNTDIDDGLDDLSENCQRVYCDNSQSDKKSARITKQLSKYSEEKIDENSKTKRYYNLSEWRKNKQNEMISSIIPLERLYVIRSNIRQFLKKWGKIEDNSNLNETEINDLKSPKELDKNWWTSKRTTYVAQFIGRGAAVTGAVLTFQDQSAIGGGILAIYPFAELLISNMEKSRETKKDKWKDFLTDADNFLDNYHELMGMLSQFEMDELKEGVVNKELKDLDGKIKEFLKDYDEDDNQEIDMEELIAGRNKLAQDLSNEKDSKIQGIIESIKRLEGAIVDYRKSSYYGTIKKESDKQASQLENIQQTEQKTHSVIELEENEQGELIEKIEIPPKTDLS